MSRLEQTLRKFTARLGSHFADDIARDPADFERQVVLHTPPGTQVHDPARLDPASSQPLLSISLALLTPTPFANWWRSYQSEARVAAPLGFDRAGGTQGERSLGTANPCGPIVLPDAVHEAIEPVAKLTGLGTYAGCSTASSTRVRPGNNGYVHHPGRSNFRQAQQDLQHHTNVEV